MKLPEFVWKFIGKKIIDSATNGQPEKWELSKAKISAILMVVVVAINQLGPAFGFDIKIPDEVFKVLEALGIFGLRDAFKGGPIGK